VKRLVFDCETDGLLEKATKVHSLVLRDLDSEEVVSCSDSSDSHPNIEYGLGLLEEAELIVGHNAIKFDVPVLKKLYPWWSPRGTVHDTMVMARFIYADIEESDYKLNREGKLPGKLIGTHKLKAWGYRLGVLKGTYAEDTESAWDSWSPSLQAYCEQDTLVTKVLYNTLMKSDRFCPRANMIEHELAWYVAQQERNGVPFNMERAIEFQSVLVGKRQRIASKLREMFGTWEVIDRVFTPKRDNKKYGYKAGVQVTKMRTVEFNPASRDHIAHILKTRYNWTPTDFTDGGKPKIDDTTLEGLTHIPECALLREYLLLAKRLGALAEGKQAWLMAATNASPEGGLLTGMHHIHGSVNQNGCVTHRASHSWPNLAQVPKVGAEYGEECRSLFVAPQGWELMGADASGLELRCLSHYMAKYDDGAYGKVILEGRNEDGTDIHSVNRNALGLSGKDGRNVAKTFIYAYLYGAGDTKLGSIMDATASETKQQKNGKKLRAAFEGNLPAIGKLTEQVQKKAQEKKYVLMPDGRRSYVRHAHAALNTLLQGAGAIICKLWIINFNRAMTERFGPQGWGGKWAACLWIHDEIQIAVRKEIAEEAAKIAVESIRKVTEQFNWRIPLDGEAKLGGNWAETH
jgi:DNA polymerase-1